MLLACPPTPGLLLLLSAMLVGVLVPVMNLGALTAVLFRRGRGVPAIHTLGKLGVLVGAGTLVAGCFAPPLQIVGAAEVVIALATIYFNTRRRLA